MKLFQAFGQFAGQAAAAVEQGMALMQPTSVSAGAGTISIVGNGQVSMTNVTDISVNGVFTSEYENYLILINSLSSAGTGYDLRFRASGSDATGADYSFQYYIVADSTITDNRSTSQTSIGNIWASGSIGYGGVAIFVYGPALASETAVRSIMGSVPNTGEAPDDIRLYDFAGVHDLATSYDGFSFFETNTTSGTLAVYGMRS